MNNEISKPLESSGDIKLMEVNDLTFDRENPRLAGFGVKDATTDNEIIKLLWVEMDVRELVMSMIASGFFQHEPLIVSEENNKKIVIEGNRRLAAVRLILNPELADELGIKIPMVDPSRCEEFQTVPAIFANRQNEWQFLGFKHINGPARWNSYAKAKYIANVHLEYTVPLEDISCQIGDTHNTVQRLFRGYRVIEQAEETGVYNREDRWNKGFYFSHLYTGLGYSGFIEYLGLKLKPTDEKDPVPKEKLSELGQVMIWLYGSRKDGKPPLIKSQNPDLRHLDAVLRHREALVALKTETELSVAFEMTRPVGTVLEEELVKAKQSLQKARGILTTGYDRSESLLRIAEQIANIAEDLWSEMMRMRIQKKPRRRQS